MTEQILPAMTQTTLLQDTPGLISPLISATILADSLSPQGVRLTTLELVYPRIILAELNTHRVFSKNSASSRAIPTKRMLAAIRKNPAVPASWRMNEAGMQGYTVADETTALAGQAIWLAAMEDAIRHAEALDALKLHKSIPNRLTEPFVHMKTVLTGVYFDNFDGLRRHHMADPTIEALAWAIYNAREESTPKELQPNEWHLPYITELDKEALTIADQCAVSAARCARTSYNNVDGTVSDYKKDLELFKRLAGAEPPHMSPQEHQATPDSFTEGQWGNPVSHGNLYGWQQFRRLLPNGNGDR